MEQIRLYSCGFLASARRVVPVAVGVWLAANVLARGAPLTTRDAAEREQMVLDRADDQPGNEDLLDMVRRCRSFDHVGIDPLAEKVKARLREHLQSKPEAKTAWVLALFIQEQLAATEIEWAAPSLSASHRRVRGHPDETYEALASVLECGLAVAGRDDPLRGRMAIALAKLKLLRGDWEGMNQCLARIGQPPVLAEKRAFLAAPPVDWKDLAGRWTLCSEPWRSGECGLVVRVEKDGKGLAGVHVLVQNAPRREQVFMSGIAADTLFLNPWPVPLREMESFGYRAKRDETRYAVSSASGEVSLEKLPDREVQIEILIPTGNFAEHGWGWDLYMETEPGKYALAQPYGPAESVRPDGAAAIAELNPGRVTRYPNLVVRPQLHLDLQNWTRVDRKMVLTWEDPEPAEHPNGYEVELALTVAPSDPWDGAHAVVLQSARQAVAGTSWAIGEKGVGEMRFVPGSIYTVRVISRDTAGQVIARSRHRYLWMPWEHRENDPPLREFAGTPKLPFSAETWYRGSFQTYPGEPVDIRQQIREFIADNRNAFEREYAQVVQAWLDWHDGNMEQAHDRLVQLAGQLPPGSVPQATAAWLVAEDDAARPLPKRLKFQPAMHKP